MEGYIIIRKKTLARAIVALCAVAIGLLAWLCFSVVCSDEPPRRVAVRSFNALQADGKDVAFFSSISADSTLEGLCLDSSNVTFAPRIALHGAGLRSVLRYTKDSLRRMAARLEASIGEMDYYLKVHGVQDEGYDMVAVHATEATEMLAAVRQELDVLEAIHKETRLGLRHSETMGGPDSLLAAPLVLAVCNGGRWLNGCWLRAASHGPGVAADSAGRIIAGTWAADTLVTGSRTDGRGTYTGQFGARLLACGHGSYAAADGSYYEGRWQADRPDGFGFAVDTVRLRAGEWQQGTYKGERLNYTSERIYGIDISRYQHGRGRRYYPIYWKQLRITDLGRISNKKISGRVDYPVSFVYIKSTEGSSVRNRYFRADYLQARRHGIRCGAYHFFSVRTPAKAQARYFIRHTLFRPGDLPPVLDVEPTDRQIAQLGGPDELFRRIRTWMNIVRRHTGVRPILYVSQSFVNKYLGRAPDIKQNYNVWIARYGEYKPDIKLVYWQLCPDGRVSGIHGDVDINVFNGYEDQFDRFIETELVK